VQKEAPVISGSRAGRKLVQVLRGQRMEPPPVWLMRQAGRYLPEYRAIRAKAPRFLDFCYTPELAIEATLQPIRRFGLDAAILFCDILVIPDALGAEVGFVEGEGPRLTPIASADGLATDAPAAVAAKLEPVYQAVRGVRELLPDATALIGFAGAPWTVATYMVEGGPSRDFATVKSLMWSDPAAFGGLIQRLVDATVAHLGAQIEAGVDAVQIFDSWAGVLPAPEFRRWCIEPTRRIVDRLKALFPDVPVIGFPRGAGAMIDDFVQGAQVDAVSIDSSMPLRTAAAMQARVAVQGNLDPVLLMTGGDAFRQRVSETVSALAGGAHVFNLGHGILPPTPPEHVAELVSIVRGAGRR
jgi:uroporphyrinogen decarboxylase